MGAECSDCGFGVNQKLYNSAQFFKFFFTSILVIPRNTADVCNSEQLVLQLVTTVAAMFKEDMIFSMTISLHTSTFIKSSFRDNTTLSGEKVEHKSLSRELYVSTHKYC